MKEQCLPSLFASPTLSLPTITSTTTPMAYNKDLHKSVKKAPRPLRPPPPPLRITTRSSAKKPRQPPSARPPPTTTIPAPLSSSRSPPTFLRISTSRNLGNSVWPRSHPRRNYLECMRRATSEPLPDMEATQAAPLTRVTSWVTPWGLVVQTSSEQVPHQKALAPHDQWVVGNIVWRKTLE